ncbi:Uncharacterized protein BM_BM10776, partial [Brugia malayi]
MRGLIEIGGAAGGLTGAEVFGAKVVWCKSGLILEGGATEERERERERRRKKTYHFILDMKVKNMKSRKKEGEREREREREI